jgi:hypothetical protein
VRFENNFDGMYFHHNLYLKTGVSRNGLSSGYSERDISSACVYKESLDDVVIPSIAANTVLKTNGLDIVILK